MKEIQTEEQPNVLTTDSENATWFKPIESRDPEKFKRFRLYNRGTWKDRREENKEVTHRKDNLAVLDAICGQLSLTDYQKDESRRLLDRLDLQSFGRPVSHIAFGLAVLVANRDARDLRYWPTRNDTDREFTKIGNEIELTEQEQVSIINTVRGKI